MVYNTSYISQVTLSSGTYDVKDAWAREKVAGLTGAMHYVGVSSTDPTSSTGPTIIGHTGDFNQGDVCLYTPTGKPQCEYVFNGDTWDEFGSSSSLGNLAFKNEASGTPTLTGTATGDIVMDSQEHTHTVKSADVSVSVSYLPQGTITGTAVTLSKTTGGASKLKTAGSVTAGAAPTLGTNIPASNITAWSAGSATTLGDDIPADDITNWDAGSLPTLGTNISADDITSWSAGSAATLGTAFSVPNVTNVGSTPTLGDDIPADDITYWSAGTMTTIDTTKFNGGSATDVNVTAGSDASLSAGKAAAWSAKVDGETLSFTWSANTLQTLTGGKATVVTYTKGTAASLSTGFYTAGTAPTLTYAAKSIPNVTNVGSTPTLGTAFSIPNVTSAGTAPTLEYTAKSIPNVTDVGSLPTLSYTAKSIPNVTSAGSAPSLTYSEQSIPNVTNVGSATSVTLPTFDSVDIVSGVASVTNGTFNGTAGTVTGTGSATVVLNSYTGTATGSFTNGAASVSGTVTVS